MLNKRTARHHLAMQPGGSINSSGGTIPLTNFFYFSTTSQGGEQMSGQQMNGYGIPQKNRKRRPPKKGPYDDLPLEVRRFLEIVEGVIRRSLAEKANVDNTESRLQVASEAHQTLIVQLPDQEKSHRAQVTRKGRDTENKPEMVNPVGNSGQK